MSDLSGVCELGLPLPVPAGARGHNTARVGIEGARGAASYGFRSIVAETRVFSAEAFEAELEVKRVWVMSQRCSDCARTQVLLHSTAAHQ